MTLTEILDIYAQLLIVQYRNKPKAIDTIKAVVNCAVCDDLPRQERDCWNLDTAVGAQLTILGKIVGVPREIVGLDLEHEYFSFTRYVDTPDSVGFGRYSDVPYSQDLFRRYTLNTIHTLTDFEMRTLIKLKIIINNKFCSMKYLTEALYDYFGTDIAVSDSGLVRDVAAATFFNFTSYSGTPASVGFGRYADDPYSDDLWDRYAYHYIMTLSYQVKSVYQKAFEAAIFLDIVPRPMACAVVTNYVN